LLSEQKRHFFSPKDKFPTSSYIHLSIAKTVNNEKSILNYTIIWPIVMVNTWWPYKKR